jgi:hypothetical protein
MTDLTVEMIEIPDGYDFIGSDGKRFFLVNKEDGHAVLFAGRRGKPSAVGIVDLDVSVADKLKAAREHALAYRIG